MVKSQETLLLIVEMMSNIPTHPQEANSKLPNIVLDLTEGFVSYRNKNVAPPDNEFGRGVGGATFSSLSALN